MNIRVKITRDGSNSIATMDMEEYLRGVVPSEMPASSAPGALRAQAVAARTFAAYKVKTRASQPFDVDDTSAYQAYRANNLHPNTDQAVRETAGLALHYNQALIDTAVYCASNGGRTVSAQERWGSARAYLPAKDDPYDKRAGYPKNGHGVGLSQRGAMQAASEGQSHLEILSFYYPETEVISMYGEGPVTEDQTAPTPEEEPIPAPVIVLGGKGVKRYTPADKDKRLSEHYTVGDLWLNPNIKDSILIDEAIVTALEAFRARFGKPVFASVNSLYRTAATNKACGGASSSLHLKGQAADIYVEGVTPYELAQYAEKLGMGGIGVYSDSTRHIHMDTRAGRTCWWVKTSGSNTPGFGGVPVTFRQGNRSPAIKDIQNYLNKAGYACGSADGVFGTNTAAALKNWQKANKLTADGIYGKASNKLMGLFDW